MKSEGQPRDCRALPENYKKFHKEVAGFIPGSRLFCDPLRTLAYGTDASFYRLIPKIVLKVRSPEEVSRILQIATRCKVPVTFRAAGTSLSGQAVTGLCAESVLAVHEELSSIRTDDVVIGPTVRRYHSAPMAER